MTERTLLASVVLFRELYDSDKDVYDVIGEFLKAALLFSQKWAVNATEAAQLLKEEFDLDLPEAVVRTTLHKRLYKRDSVVSFHKGVYSTSQSQLSPSQSLVDELETLRKYQEEIIAKLTSYVESIEGRLDDEQRALLSRCFCDYLFDKDLNTRFSDSVSAFIIANQDEPGFTDQLNAVREGFVLYDGVRHTPDVNAIGSWKSKLVVFLDTEHLFNAVGLNGTLYQQLFSDFSRLASDVRSSGRRLISLRYFSESSDEAERFFKAAEHVIEGRATLDPSKPAMLSILDGCGSKSDVLEKKARFYSDLQSRGIYPAESSLEVTDAEYNVESADMLADVQSDLEGKGREYFEAKCLSTLRMFTKINTLRRGQNKKPFEEIGFILVSGSYIASFLAFHSSVRGENGGVTYATDLDFITNRLWFKLHKSLSQGVAHPQSLNVLAKAQVVLSAQIKNSVSEKFDRIKSDFDSGTTTKDQTQYLFNELRSHSTSPEALGPAALETALSFLDHNDYENHLRERSRLEKQAADGRAAVDELNSIRAAQAADRRRSATRWSYVLHGALVILLIGVAVASVFAGYYLLTTLGSGASARLTAVSILATVVVGIAPVVCWKWIWSWIVRSHERAVERICANRT
ncbi:hypothetical protein [Chromohalobacter sp. 296-RDG]|uniref:hypothetical protein n=1 Tax=Chromohalobacter sp. 296-RDG TaxID=2994062 RepID=UPI0024695D9F|nr:hypothetical protein [Chromohalobacter sp. 296-RDG]